MEKTLADAKSPKSRKGAAGTVDDFMRDLEHPFKAEIQALRSIILGADPDVTEGIKWKVPSFARGEYFATLHLRAPDGVHVIFHLGAKVRDLGPEGIAVADPTCLLQWLAKDRAIAKFRDVADIESRRAELEALVREWIAHLR